MLDVQTAYQDFPLYKNTALQEPFCRDDPRPYNEGSLYMLDVLQSTVRLSSNYWQHGPLRDFTPCLPASRNRRIDCIWLTGFRLH